MRPSVERASDHLDPHPLIDLGPTAKDDDRLGPAKLHSGQPRHETFVDRAPAKGKGAAHEKRRPKAPFIKRMVEPRGIEPLTSAMPLQRSPS